MAAYRNYLGTYYTCEKKVKWIYLYNHNFSKIYYFSTPKEYVRIYFRDYSLCRKEMLSMHWNLCDIFHSQLVSTLIKRIVNQIFVAWKEYAYYTYSITNVFLLNLNFKRLIHTCMFSYCTYKNQIKPDGFILKRKN